VKNSAKSNFIPKNDRLWKPLAQQLRAIGVSKRTAQSVLRTAVRRALHEANPALNVSLAAKEAQRVAMKFAA
jgi:hypothetical protein